MVDGAFYVVRGERGEIRIEITPDTQLSEKFKFGDRIKAVLLPNDKALSVTRAQSGESIGTVSAPTSSEAPGTPVPTTKPADVSSTPPLHSSPSKDSQVRIIVADLLMIDGNLYIIRSERGEIQIEVTPQTQLSEAFKFGDRIRARVTPQDKALSIDRANPGETPGIRLEGISKSSSLTPPPVVAVPPPSASETPKKDAPSTDSAKDAQQIRTVVAEVLMVDGDFYVVRGDRGEIRIEVTPDTALSESFKFGDKIRAKILPNDTALSIERAGKDDPSGVRRP